MERLFNEEQQLRNSFPLCLKAFPILSDACNHFVTDFKNSSKEELQRQFPMYLKEQKYSPEIYSLAQYEYLLGFVSKFDDFKEVASELELNPSFETLALHFDYPQINLTRGLFAFFKTKSESICIIKLTPDQARIVDLLKEDFSWSSSSLVKCLEEAFLRPTNYWSEELNRMKEMGVF